MRTLINRYVLLFMVTLSSYTFQKGYAQTKKQIQADSETESIEHFRDLGLIAQLAEIKIVSEARLAELSNSSNDESKMEAIQCFNVIRAKMSMIILQLTADIQADNSVKRFRKLDRYYKMYRLADYASGKDGEYRQCFSSLFNSYKEFIGLYNKKTVDVLSLMEPVLKNHHDANVGKVTNLTQLLTALQLDAAEDKKANP